MKEVLVFKNNGVRRMPVENEVSSAGAGESVELTKVCKACGRELPLSAFNIHTRSADGRMSECKECRRRKANASRKTNDSDPLAQFTARQLMDELFKRGYRGELKYTQVHVITLGK